MNKIPITKMPFNPPYPRSSLLSGIKIYHFFPTFPDVAILKSPFVVLLRAERMTADRLRCLLARNLHDAVRWIETAAQVGHPAAQVVWGQLLLDGHGVAQDQPSAFSWFKRAAAQDDIEARNMLGRCFEQGWGVAADSKRAIEAFEIAAAKGHVWGQVNLAQMLMRAGDPVDRPRCFALFKAAAESGTTKPQIKAMNSLARFLENGWCGSPDSATAAFWYLKAAGLGDHWAQFNLATILFRQGENEAAYQWLRTAIAISDNGFRRRVTPLLLARPEHELRQIGFEALQFCLQGDAPENHDSHDSPLSQGDGAQENPVMPTAFSDPVSATSKALVGRSARPKRLNAIIRHGIRKVLGSARYLLTLIGLPTKESGNAHED